MKLLTIKAQQSEVSSVNMNTAIKDLTLSANTKTRVSDKENTKSENLTEYLVEAIVNGELPPGSKIRSLNWPNALR